MPVIRQTPLKGTEQQEAIWDTVCTTNDHLQVVARAGCGKTTTAVEAAVRLKKSFPSEPITFTTFGNDVAAELRKNLPPDCTANTLHSLGFRSLRDSGFSIQDVDRRKVTRILQRLSCPHYLRYPLTCIVSAVKHSALKPGELHTKDLLYIVERLAIDMSAVLNFSGFSDVDSLTELLRRVLAIVTEETSTIDYDDMLYLPHVFDIPIVRGGTLIIDEAQDLDILQHTCLRRAQGRVISVGDPAQSIYQWRGALADSMKRLNSYFPGVILPLTVSFRCPKSVGRLARKYVPDFSVLPDASDGSVKQSEKEALYQPGDFVLCRLNAPLVQRVLQCWGRFVPAYYVKRDLTQELLSFIPCKGNPTLDDVIQNAYSRLSHARTIAEAEWTDEAGNIDHETVNEVLSTIHDRVNCLTSLVQLTEDVESLRRDIEELTFPVPDSVRFSSIHRAKGLEADNVVILNWQKLAGAATTSEQEKNCAYVAVTRTKNHLSLVC